MRPELLPQASVVRTDVRRYTERNVAYSRATRRASRAAPPPAPGGWGIYATIIAFGLAVCLTGYLAIGESERNFYLGRGAATPAAHAESRGDVAAKADARVGTAAKVAATLPSLAVDTEAFYEPAADEHLAIFESLALAPRAIPDRKVARGARGGRDASAALGAKDARNTSTEPTPSRVASVAFGAAPTALAEPVAPDRWQQLVSEQLRCERENVIAGFVCKERARLQYCEGEWGAAPQCPVAVLSLNTR